MGKLRIECENLAKSEEDVLLYAMFPDLAQTFLQERNAGTLKAEPLLPKDAAAPSAARYAPNEFKVTLHGETFHIKLTGSGQQGEEQRPFYVSVDGVSEEVMVETLSEIEVSGGKSGGKKKAVANASGSSRPRPSHEGCVTTAMPGTIVDVKVKTGDTVNAGDGVLVIEAMKMENEIQASKGGVVIAVHVKKGDAVTPDETLIETSTEQGRRKPAFRFDAPTYPRLLFHLPARIAGAPAIAIQRDFPGNR